LEAYRRASARLRQGEEGVAFPEGSYAPSRGWWPVEVRAG
jgi:hypothetical protein